MTVAECFVDNGHGRGVMAHVGELFTPPPSSSQAHVLFLAGVIVETVLKRFVLDEVIFFFFRFFVVQGTCVCFYKFDLRIHTVRLCTAHVSTYIE